MTPDRSVRKVEFLAICRRSACRISEGGESGDSGDSRSFSGIPGIPGIQPSPPSHFLAGKSGYQWQRAGVGHGVYPGPVLPYPILPWVHPPALPAPVYMHRPAPRARVSNMDGIRPWARVVRDILDKVVILALFGQSCHCSSRDLTRTARVRWDRTDERLDSVRVN